MKSIASPRPNPRLNHRRTRIQKWTLLCAQGLATILAQCEAQLSPKLRADAQIWLSGLTRIVMNLLVARVYENVRALPSTHRRAGFNVRAALGARMRRRFKRATLTQSFAFLVEILRDLETHVAPLTRRVRNGFTRLRPLRVARAPQNASSFRGAREREPGTQGPRHAPLFLDPRSRYACLE
jgi:hypothetical protein